MYVNQLFNYDEDIDISFKSQINNINTIFFNNQIKNIMTTLSLIKQNNLNIEFNNTIKKQTILAYKWCKYYKISVNYNSKYLVKYSKFIN